MAEVAQHLPIESSILSEGKEFLARTLDNLLEQYLHLLHQYQTLQQELHRDLADGYISLAQANFSNQNRIRYGQDFYDERMQAITRVSLNVTTPTFSVILPPTSPWSQLSEKNSPENPKANSDNAFEEREDVTGTSEKTSDADCEPTPRDPLNWFGILLPPALKRSQAVFKSAATGIIPLLASTVKEMKEIELEVRRTRKKLRKAG